MDLSIKTQSAVLHTLYRIQLKWRRTYSWAMRSTIQKYLKKYYSIEVCLSTVSYHLWVLHINDLIRVYTRYGTKLDGTHYNLPSNRQITGKGIVYLKRLGVNVVNWLYNWAFKGIKPPKVIAKTEPHENPDFSTGQPRRSASPPEILENVLSDTLNSLK
jgi:hypothetical protein